MLPEPLITLKDYPLPDPGMSKAEQVDRLINRNTIPWSDGKFDAGIKELKRAVELSPPDFPTARLNLAYVQDAMGKLDEAEVLYWEHTGSCLSTWLLSGASSASWTRGEILRRLKR